MYLTIQHILQSFRQDEVKGESTRRIKIREYRRDLKNSFVSSFVKYMVLS
ncbi:palindromic element RPE3 domain-containing protein [Rickettsia felis]|nr:palindromic element RPE3 domain-containing protein [Rickettsia felis]MDE8612009.1 palindromic element RPE3 domain-containing protein [Rickettsia felis]